MTITTTTAAGTGTDLTQAEAIELLMDMIAEHVGANSKKVDRLNAIQDSVEAMLAAVAGVDFPGSSVAHYRNITGNGVRLNRTQSGDVVAVDFDPEIGRSGPARQLRFHDFRSGDVDE
jgi:hypothetical protein